MQSIDEILSAAAKLPQADLGKLRSAIDRLDRDANAIALDVKKMTFRLYRQTESEHWASLRESLRIEEDYGFYLRMHYLRKPGQELNFAHVYLTLNHLCGASSCWLDDYKMAFSFPFAMDVIKGDQTFAYFLDARNIRDSLYFSLRKKVDPKDPRLKDGFSHPPFADEFSQEEIQLFISYFYGYLLGRWETLRDWQTRQPGLLQPFVRRVPANLIIFGWCGGKAFEEKYESEEEYKAAWQRYEQQVERELELNKADSFILLDGRPLGGRG